jgi:glutaredoxin
MAELKHTIKYRYVCEQCGKQTDWFALDIEGEKHHEIGLEKAVMDLAENAHARLDKEIRAYKERTSNGNYTYFMGGASCPFCGKRQSWLPAADVTTFSPAARIVLYMTGWFFIGLALYITVTILRQETDLFEWIPYDAWAAFIFLPPLIGLVLAILRNRKNTKANEEQSKSAAVRNVPEIDWNGV